jgi:glycosyltransferase involved in cell wall biosynthesis
MNICYIASTIEVPYRAGLGSGGSTHAYEVARTLADLGDTVHVFCRRSLPEQMEQERLGNLVIHRFFHWNSIAYKALKGCELLWRAARIPYYLLRSILHTIQLLHLAQKERFAVIYERSSSATLAGTCAALILRLPLVLEVNDQGYQPLSLRVAQKIVTPEREMIPSHARQKVTPLEWGVNTQMFHPSVDGRVVRRECGIERRDVILFLGSGLPWHGLRDIVEAAPLVLEKTSNAVFLIVGGGPGIGAWKRMVGERGLREWFRFTGAVAYAQVPRYVAASDIALAPYNSRLVEHERHRFASPLKVFEYMAGGKAVVVTRVANARQIIEDSLTGLVIPEDSPVALAAAILRLLRAPGLRRSLGERARTVAEQRYSWERHCVALREVFAATTQSSHKKRNSVCRRPRPESKL